MSDEVDRADVARVRMGDRDAFAGIVRRWQGPLLTLAYRFCRDHGRAEDMTQVAFVTAYRKLSRWSGDSKFSSWLFAVATNVFRSELRRARIPVMPLELARELASLESESADGKSGTEKRNRRIVQLAVLGLPPKYRDAVVLFYFHDLNVREAAQSLRIPVGTLKARLHRGRMILARELGTILAKGAGFTEDPQ